jgi:hypothetical protein
MELAMDIYVCSSCLEEMVQRLRKNIVDNFENDFQESRKEKTVIINGKEHLFLPLENKNPIID